MDAIILKFLDSAIAFKHTLIYRKHELVFLRSQDLVNQFIEYAAKSHEAKDVERLRKAIQENSTHYKELFAYAELGAFNPLMELKSGKFDSDIELTGIDLLNIYSSVKVDKSDPILYAQSLAAEEVGPLRSYVAAEIFLYCQLYSKGIPALFNTLQTAWRYPNHYWNTPDSIFGIALALNRLLDLLLKHIEHLRENVPGLDKLVKITFLFTSRAIYLNPTRSAYLFVLRANIAEHFNDFFEGQRINGFEIEHLAIADYYKSFNEGGDPSRDQIYSHLVKLAEEKEVDLENIESYSWFNNLAIGSFSSFLISLEILKLYSANSLYLKNSEIGNIETQLHAVLEDNYDGFVKFEADKEVRSNRTRLEENSAFANKAKAHLSHAPTYFGFYNYCVQEYSQHIPYSTFQELSRGTKVLDTEIKLTAYFIAYGVMHYYKIDEACIASNNVFKTSLPITIVDYACGQAIATNVLMEYLAKRGVKSNIKSIILIEPSNIAPKRGVVLLNMLLNNASLNPDVKIINKLLHELGKSDLATNDSDLKIHFFSNILDMPEIDLVELVNNINQNFRGDNLFVCTSPSYGKQRIDIFKELLCTGKKCVIDIVQSQDIGKKQMYLYVKGVTGDYLVTRYTRILGFKL